MLAGALTTFNAFGQGSPQMNLPRMTLNAGMHLIQVQVAQDFEQRQIGLMWRKEMPQNEGMLFVFEQAAVQCFWMRNTLLPLTAAFVADDGTIVNLADMKPQSDDSHCSNNIRHMAVPIIFSYSLLAPRSEPHFTESHHALEIQIQVDGRSNHVGAGCQQTSQNHGS